MRNDASAMKITLEISQSTNLDDLMAHLYLMQEAMPAKTATDEGFLPDFSIHEGELAPVERGFTDV